MLLSLCRCPIYHHLFLLSHTVTLLVALGCFVATSTTVQSNFAEYCSNQAFLTAMDPDFSKIPYNSNACYYDNRRRILCLSISLITPAMIFMVILSLLHVVMIILTHSRPPSSSWFVSYVSCLSQHPDSVPPILDDVADCETKWCGTPNVKSRGTYWIANISIIIGSGALVLLVYQALSVGFVYNNYPEFCSQILELDVKCDLGIVNWLITTIASIFIICLSYNSRQSWRWLILNQAIQDIENLSSEMDPTVVISEPKQRQITHSSSPITSSSTCATLGLRSTIIDLFKGITNIMMTFSHVGAFFLAVGDRGDKVLDKIPSLGGFFKFSFISAFVDFPMFVSSFAYLLYIANFDSQKPWRWMSVGRTIGIIYVGYIISSLSFFYMYDRWTSYGIDRARKSDFYAFPNLPIEIATFQHLGGWSEFLASLALMYSVWYPLRHLVSWSMARPWAWMSLCLCLLLLNIIKLYYNENQLWPAIFLNQYLVPSFPMLPFSYLFIFGMVIAHHDGFIRNLNHKYPVSLVITCWIAVSGFFITCTYLTPLGPLVTIIPQTYSRFGSTAPNYLVGPVFFVLCIAIGCSFVEWSRFQLILRYADTIFTLRKSVRLGIHILTFPYEFIRECILHFGRNTLIYLILTNVLNFSLSPDTHPDGSRFVDVSSLLALWITELVCIRFIIYVIHLNLARTIERQHLTTQLIATRSFTTLATNDRSDRTDDHTTEVDMECVEQSLLMTNMNSPRPTDTTGHRYVL